MSDLHDCLIVGAGPAGLTAATYLARYRRDVVVLDAGRSRARWIPASHNCPGFPFGVAGNELLARFRAQAESHRVPFEHVCVDAVDRAGEAFRVSGGAKSWRARSVLLATGVVDRLPRVEGVEEAIAAASLRLCAVCDAYEARDEAIGVYAPLEEGLGHAAFLRTFSAEVHLLVPDDVEPSAEQRARAREAGLAVHTGVRGLRFPTGGCAAVLRDGTSLRLDTVYPVLGSDASAGMVASLAPTLDADGKLVVDGAMQTSVPGLFAAGDIVSGLNQISVAVGHAAVAATAIHRRLPPNPRIRTACGPGSRGSGA
jgi:thioredoxin reductase (NADPH)